MNRDASTVRPLSSRNGLAPALAAPRATSVMPSTSTTPAWCRRR